jgi:peptide/nickel transport system permease protein
VTGVARFLAARLALALVTLVAISIVTFVATSVVPANPAKVALGKFATPEQLASYEQQQGLRDPVTTRYLHWVGNLARGRWGNSVLSQQSVSSLVDPRVVRTLILGFAAMLIAVPLAFLLGVYSAQRAGRRSDTAISFAALVTNSLPEFVVGIAFLLVLAVALKALPIESSGAAFGTGADKAKAYVLPVLALATVLTPYIARMVRANVRDVSAQPFVRSASLRGLSRRRIMWRHIVPSASLPVVNVVALSMAELIGGVVVLESVFGFPGVGQLLVDSVSSKDIPTVQVIALIIGVGFVALNFLADAVVLLLNPRLRSR